MFNAVYRRTREQIDGHPCFASATRVHLFRHPEHDEWHLTYKPFDPTDAACAAWIPAVGGHVPTGAQAWNVLDSDGEWVDAEATAREVA